VWAAVDKVGGGGRCQEKGCLGVQQGEGDEGGLSGEPRARTRWCCLARDKVEGTKGPTLRQTRAREEVRCCCVVRKGEYAVDRAGVKWRVAGFNPGEVSAQAEARGGGRRCSWTCGFRESSHLFLVRPKEKKSKKDRDAYGDRVYWAAVRRWVVVVGL